MSFWELLPTIIDSGTKIASVGASIYGAAQGANAAEKAASTQAAASDRAADVAREIFHTSRDDFAPFRMVGANALGELAALYGILPEMPAGGGGAAAPAFEGQKTLDELRAHRDAGFPHGNFGTPGAVNARIAELEAQQRAAAPAAAPASAAPGQTPGAAARGRFFESPGYQFRLTEGLKAIDRSSAARGLLDSGAAVKAAQRFGEGLAADEFNTYTNRLASMAGLGQTAAGQTAQAGQTFAGQAGRAIQDAGTARASGYVGGANAINGGVNNLITLGYLYGGKR